LARLSFREHDSQRAKARPFPLELETESLLQPETRVAWESETLSCASISSSMSGWEMELAKLSFVLVKLQAMEWASLSSTSASDACGSESALALARESF